MSIKLNLKAALASLLRPFRGINVDKTYRGPSSIVLLLHKPDFPNLKQLSAYAEEAFKVPFATENATDFCVFQKVLFTFMQIGPHVLSFLFYTKPYFDEVGCGFAKTLPLPAQRIAWNEHTAWLATNYAEGPADEDTQYAILSKLNIEMLDGNCTGAYGPGEQLFIPNNRSLLNELRQNAVLFPGFQLPPTRPN